MLPESASEESDLTAWAQDTDKMDRARTRYQASMGCMARTPKAGRSSPPVTRL
ncbi:hypothetical protein OH77DRAFT_1431088 [Trametes cingulata]|nr:hypothetical protein OH77DRAFT_1431088 [Trametes cingulata]